MKNKVDKPDQTTSKLAKEKQEPIKEEKVVSKCLTCDCMYPCGASRSQNSVDSYWR